MAAEVHGFVLGYDYSLTLKNILGELLGREVPLEAFVDSRTLFIVVAKDSITKERRVQIDTFSLRQSYYGGYL